MNASVALVSAVNLMISNPHVSHEEIKTGDKAIDGLIADIAEGRRDRAIDNIADITNFSGQRKIARTPAQFVDRLLNCTPIAGSMKAFVGEYSFSVMWVCGETKYRTIFDSLHARPYLEVLLQDERLLSEPVFAPAPPVPPRAGAAPDPLSPPLALLNKVAAVAISGGGTLPIPMRSSGSVRLYRRDVSAKVSIVERDEEGAAPFADVTREAFQKVGRPTGFSCVSGKYLGTCTFNFARPGVGLKVEIGASAGTINFIDYTWQTSEQNKRDAAR